MNISEEEIKEYRLLTDGEEIKVGDELYKNKISGWIAFEQRDLKYWSKLIWKKGNRPVRRKIS